MIIIARFIGSSSLGYIHGKDYKLKVDDRLGMSVTRIDGGGYCPYESLSAFLKNWDRIIHINKQI